MTHKETQSEIFDKVFAINVDIQNDFCPGGALGVTDGDQVVAPMNTVNRWVREQRGRVIFTADWHPIDTKHFSTFGGPWPPHCIRHRAGAAFHDDLEIGDRDNIAHKGMSKEDDGYSGYKADLTLESSLYDMGDGRHHPGVHTVAQAVERAIEVYSSKGFIDHRPKRVALVIGGLATDYCVKATVLDALDAAKKIRLRSGGEKVLGVFVVKDAIRAVNINPSDGVDAIDEMRQAGAQFVTSDDLVMGRVLEAAR